MNPNQEATLSQATVTALQMNQKNLGGGVKDIYVIANAQNSPDFRHYSFYNGAEGLNAGLCRVTIANNPDTWPEMLAKDIADMTPKEK